MLARWSYGDRIAIARRQRRGGYASSGDSATVDYLVPIDPMDELHCESCQ